MRGGVRVGVKERVRIGMRGCASMNNAISLEFIARSLSYGKVIQGGVKKEGEGRDEEQRE